MTPTARLLLPAMLATALTLCSCASGPALVGPQAKLVENEDSAAYFDRISSQTAVTENDALRGLLLLLDGKDTAVDFAQRVELLQERDIAPRDWNYSAERPITKGKLAYLIYRACHMTGGATLTLLGPNQRYCLRELQYKLVMSQGDIFSEVAGQEMVAIIQRADAYRQTGKVPASIATSPMGEKP